MFAPQVWSVAGLSHYITPFRIFPWRGQWFIIKQLNQRFPKSFQFTFDLSLWRTSVPSPRQSHKGTIKIFSDALLLLYAWFNYIIYSQSSLGWVTLFAVAVEWFRVQSRVKYNSFHWGLFCVEDHKPETRHAWVQSVFQQRGFYYPCFPPLDTPRNIQIK